MTDETKIDLAAAQVSTSADCRRDSVPLGGTASTPRSLSPPDATQGEPAGCSTAPRPDAPDLTVETKLGETCVEDVAPIHSGIPGATLSEKDLEKGAERAQLLKAARPFFGQASLEKIADMLGTSPATLCRLREIYIHLTDDELTPENLAAKTKYCGRKSQWEMLAALPAVQQRLKQLYLLSCRASSDYMTKDRHTGSMALALEFFADDPLCPPELGAKLRRGKFPRCLINVIRTITAEMEQAYRGPKHQSLNAAMTMRRNLDEIMPDGEVRQVTPGDWWVFDDMSDNQPNWFLAPDGTPLVGRQGLYAFDICRWWMGLELIGTPRDSYTAAIILRFMRRLMQVGGKPRRGVILEKSVWAARVIKGYRLTAAGQVFEEDFEREEMSDECRATIHQGLAGLGIKVHYTHTPRGKEIEGGFGYLQKVAQLMSPEHIRIGAHAGEFEKGAKALRRAHAQSHHPAALHFAEMDARADVLTKSMEWINAREARKPDSVVAGRYPALGKLSENDMAVFLPHRSETQLKPGKVTAMFEGQEFDFSHPEMFASLGAAFRVSLKFDPSEPTLGAAIYNREASSKNHRGWQEGQFICWADFVPEIARFDWRPKAGRTDTAGDLKKRFNKFVRTAFRAVGMPEHRASTARDGQGNVAIVEKTNAAPKLPARVVQQRPALSPEQITQRGDRLSKRAEIKRKLFQED